MSLAAWMSKPTGRIVRVVAGLVLIGMGLYFHGMWGYAIAVIGVVPVLAGALNVCLIGPILGAPFRSSSAA